MSRKEAGLKEIERLPWQSRGWDFAFQTRGCWFDPWSRSWDPTCLTAKKSKHKIEILGQIQLIFKRKKKGNGALPRGPACSPSPWVEAKEDRESRAPCWPVTFPPPRWHSRCQYVNTSRSEILRLKNISHPIRTRKVITTEMEEVVLNYRQQRFWEFHNTPSLSLASDCLAHISLFLAHLFFGGGVLSSSIWFLFLVFKTFLCGPFLRSLLTFLQYFCFMF